MLNDLTQDISKNTHLQIIFLLAILSIFVVLILFSDIIFTANQFAGEYHDLLAYHIPHLLYQNNAFPLWNNLFLTGYPEFASSQSDIYYPITLLFIHTIDNLFVQVNLAIMLHLIVAFFTSYLLFSHITKDTINRIIFSLAYIVSTIILIRINAGHELIVFSLTWIPLLYYSFINIAYKNERTIQNIVLFILPAVLITFSGAIYYLVYPYFFLIIAAAYLLYAKQTELKSVLVLLISTLITGIIISIRAIPTLEIVDKITKIDFVDKISDALGGGGSLESNLASFAFGNPINEGYSYVGLQYGSHESAVFLGLTTLILVITALVYGRKHISVPAFLTILFAFIWADGGKIIFSFIHLLPILSSTRCPGRIYGALFPILLLLALYALLLINRKIQNNDSFSLSETQRKRLLYGIVALVGLKICEIPYQEGFTIQSIVATVFVLSYLAVIYLNKLTKEGLIAFMSAGILLNVIFFASSFIGSLTLAYALKAIIIAAVFIILFRLCITKSNTLDDELLSTDPEDEQISDNNTKKKSKTSKFKRPTKTSAEDNTSNMDNAQIPRNKFNAIFIALVAFGIIFSSVAAVTLVKGYTPAYAQINEDGFISEINNHPTDSTLKWAYTTRSGYQDMDYSYILIKNGIHSAKGYFAYYLNTMLPLSYNIGNTQYFTSDYIVDTAYLDSGNLAIQNYTFMADGVPVTVTENVLPNAFILRNGNEIIIPTVEKFTPDEIVISGDFKAGDIAVLKTAYYNGWKINNEDAVNAGNMPATELKSDTQRIVYNFAPASFTIGLALTVIGIIILIAMIIFRKRVEELIK